jgi:hypothetical protein
LKTKLIALVFAVSLAASSALAATAGSVTVSSPTNGSTVTSPVSVVASATANGGRKITAMKIYVDSVSVYSISASSINTKLTIAAGSHHMTVQAWDNSGAVYKNSLNITVASAPTPPPPPPPSNTNQWGWTKPASSVAPYSTDLSSTSNWLATTWAANPDGGLFDSDFIRPYLGNLAALGMVRDPNRYAAVQAWMQWYIAHLNYGDKWGLSGTIYDYNVSLTTGAETSTNTADSTDSYAATFLSLAWAYYQTGDPNAQAYVASIASSLDLIGGVIAQTQQSDGLTWALPDYLIKYLMDNCEVQRGLRDAASLFNAIGMPTKGSYYSTLADANLAGLNGMYLGNGVWAYYKGFSGTLYPPNMTNWYPDATSQIFPILQGVVPASDARAQATYAAFNSAWPGWPNLSYTTQDPFPWVLVSGAAAQMGDTARVNTYIQNIQNLYVNTGFGGYFYDNEAGWFIRTNWYMEGGRPY